MAAASSGGVHRKVVGVVQPLWLWRGPGQAPAKSPELNHSGNHNHHNRRVSFWGSLSNLKHSEDKCPRPQFRSRSWPSLQKRNLEVKSIDSSTVDRSAHSSLSSCSSSNSVTQQALPAQTGAVQLPTRPGADVPSGTAITSTTNFHVETRLRPSTVNLPLAEKPGVTHIEIHTPILFHAPLYQCTIHILNHSPLLSLSVDGLGLTHYDWTHILPSIRIPTLQSLALGDSQIAFPDLVAFLKRHKDTLRKLDLSKGVAIGGLKSTNTKGLLANVEELTANPEYLGHFLGSGPEDLPRLKAVTVTSEYGAKERMYDYSQFDGVFKCLARRPMNGEHSRLSIGMRCLSSPGLEEWLVDGSKNSKVADVLKKLHLEELRVGLQAMPPLPETLQTAFLAWVALFGSIDNVRGISDTLL
ncbi:hypothetical protein BDN72DRAFT_60683 [Pluteus cervinus]|uniref:Uncharacterized protein n=1 Tax=Pluteus cervinus TaxID=181527 RepID=A0ACD3AQE4_9AGAR|nr:hypothetical protein BDN72DRAFT_60683 [Pluteus cervinus]